MIKLREDKKFTENLELESFLFSKLWYNLVFDSLDAKQMPQPLIIQGLQHF